MKKYLYVVLLYLYAHTLNASTGTQGGYVAVNHWNQDPISNATVAFHIDYGDYVQSDTTITDINGWFSIQCDTSYYSADQGWASHIQGWFSAFHTDYWEFTTLSWQDFLSGDPAVMWVSQISPPDIILSNDLTLLQWEHENGLEGLDHYIIEKGIYTNDPVELIWISLETELETNRRSYYLKENERDGEKYRVKAIYTDQSLLYSNELAVLFPPKNLIYNVEEHKLIWEPSPTPSIDYYLVTFSEDKESKEWQVATDGKLAAPDLFEYYMIDSGYYYWRIYAFKTTRPGAKSLSTYHINYSDDVENPVIERELYVSRGYVLKHFPGIDKPFKVFKVDRHGFSFSNSMIECVWPVGDWQPYCDEPLTYPEHLFCNLNDPSKRYKPESVTFPSWGIYEKAFNLKVAASLRTYEYIEGVEHWHDIRGYWKGSCYGFAVAALLAFNNHQAFSNDFPRVSPAGLDIYSLDCTGSVRDMINTVFTKQYKSQEYGIDNLTGHISSVLKIIKIYLSKTQDPLDAVFWLGRKQNVSKHAIIPIALEKPFPATDYEDLIVYDPNYPGQEQIVKLDLKHDTFFYRGYATDETNHIGFSEPLSNFYD